MVQVQVKKEHGRVRIIGLLDEVAVMEVNNCVGDGTKFSVSSSSCLPVDLGRAKKMLQLYQFVMEEVEYHEEPDCSACGGSGFYDAEGNPPCGACGGTGRQ